MIMAPSPELVDIQNPGEDLKVKKTNLKWRMDSKGKEQEAEEELEAEEECQRTEEEEEACLDLVQGAG
jgi:hypothetical protein